MQSKFKVQSSFICNMPSTSRQNTTANQYTYRHIYLVYVTVCTVWGCHVERNTEDPMNGNMNCGMATTEKTALHPPSPWTTYVKDDPLVTHSVQQGKGDTAEQLTLECRLKGCLSMAPPTSYLVRVSVLFHPVGTNSVLVC